MTRRVQGVKFVGGSAEAGRLRLLREDGSVVTCGVVIVQGVSLTDNEDSTLDVTFDGS